MKQTQLAALVIALTIGSGAALAQHKMGDMKDMDMGMGKQKMEGMKNMDMGGQKAMSGAQVTHKARGVVTKLDAKDGSVTFDHEPVKSLNWPAMSMTFAVKDKMLFDKLTLGKKAEFEFVQDGKRYVVTGVK